jgi:carboxylesterase
MTLSSVRALIKRKRFWFFTIPFLTAVFIKAFVWTPFLIKDTWMDSPLTQDESLTDPSYLVSSRFSELTDDILNTPVLVASHGYSSTTFETDELRAHLESRGVLVSQVLMGGHGRDLDAFINSSWQDWGQPILEEIHRLEDLGFKHISVLGISAAGAIIAHYLDQGKLTGKAQHVILVDPFIESFNKMIYLAPYLGSVINNSPAWIGRNQIKLENWYNNNPSQALNQLVNLIKQNRRNRSDGVPIPESMDVLIFQSTGDLVSDPSGTYDLFSSLNGEKSLIKIESVHHVTTQGAARDAIEWSLHDEKNQLFVFDTIRAHLTAGH